MKRWLAGSLKHKLSFMLVGSLLVPVLLLGVVSYQLSSSVTEEKAKQSGMNTLRQIRTNLEFIVQDVENMSVFLIGHGDTQKYLNHKQTDATEYLKMIGFLTNLAFSKKYISDITIQPRGDRATLSTFFNDTVTQSGAPDPLAEQPDYFAKHPKYWTSLYENETFTGVKRVISLIRPIRDINNFKTLGMLTISLNEEVISTYLKTSGLESNGYVLLLDSEGRIISGGPSPWLNRKADELFPGIALAREGASVKDYGEGEEKKTILFDQVPNVGWTLMGVIPYNEYKAQNRYVITLTAVAVAVAIVLLVGLVLYLVHRVTRPLEQLTRILKNANPDGKMQTFPVTTVDEVGQLMHTYNKFSNRIQHLTEQVKTNEARKKEADMQALQAQINPHFLYNTLSSVHWMALMSKDMQIAEMVGALSDFLRFSLNKGEEFCPVSQEIAHAQNYANIQSIRFPDQFEIRFIIHPELGKQSMLKLVLQPLIENALIHGIQKKREPGTIHVVADQTNGSMTFTVEDTGVGMDETTLRSLQDQLETALYRDDGSGSYGLRNVQRRLVLHYGLDSRLSIESAPGKGTKASFTIPIREGAS
ncbi:sensor histidine kinase [Paenibacillus sp. MSJ-34]|uniref:cache domain-containing sensor histidine kinase n=1 Tax=Paenibacillus sp. MSJ-34 TaxID=2841529 RepID=UPI001C0FFD03|nr:sensor histidine kinase [Paenibacillus sp. MSJ-34]MBU5442248.1 sensor histidine kinase [Paenibacillus sp. MSJ-34]